MYTLLGTTALQGTDFSDIPNKRKCGKQKSINLKLSSLMQHTQNTEFWN